MSAVRYHQKLTGPGPDRLTFRNTRIKAANCNWGVAPSHWLNLNANYIALHDRQEFNISFVFLTYFPWKNASGKASSSRPQDSRVTSQNTRPLLSCSTKRYRGPTVERLVLYMYPVRCHYSRQLRCVHFIQFQTYSFRLWVSTNSISQTHGPWL